MRLAAFSAPVGGGPRIAVSAADIPLLGATEDSMRREAFAFSFGRSGGLERTPQNWQLAPVPLLLPRAKAFVLLKVSVVRQTLETNSTTGRLASFSFPCHFVDDIRASIRFREAVPAQRARSGT